MFNSFLRFFKRLISMLLALIFSSELNATHIRAMDIYYECLGNNTYTFYIKYYRDCGGIPLSTNGMVLNIRSPNCGITMPSVNMALISGPTDVSQLCPSQMPFNSCNGSSIHPGTEEYIFSATVQLTAQCNDWTIYHSRCCRNNAVTNVNVAAQSMYIEATLDNTNGQCNNSPQFSNMPILYGCAGMPYALITQQTQI